MFTMADNERKSLTWTIKKKLFNLSPDELLQLAMVLSQEPTQAKLVNQDEESCIDYLCSYMESTEVQESDDQGISELRGMLDILDEVIAKRTKSDLTGARADVGVTVVSDISGANVSSRLTESAHTDTHTIDTHFDTAPFDLAAQTDALASHISKLMSSYDDLCKKVKQGGASFIPHTSSTTLPSASHQFTHHRQNTNTDIRPTDSHQSIHHNTHTITNAPPTPYHQSHSPHTTTDTQHIHQSHSPHPITSSHLHYDQPPSHHTGSMIALRDLPFLQKKEFKIHGGQIGDNTSEITYSNISKQVDQGLREMHTEDEVIRAVFRIIKPGNFKDMLSSKDDMTIAKLKSFLQSHLGEKSSTELFQELISGKQHEHETPQQFLYRMMGLKQKVIFKSKQTDSDIKYEAQTAQNVFLRTVSQGLNEKHDDIRRELKPLLSDPAVKDDVLLRQVNKTTSEESERKRRLGRNNRPKTAQAHSSEVTTSQVDKEKPTPDTQAKDELIQQLSAQVQALTEVVTSLQSKAAPKPLRPGPQPQSTCQCATKQNQSQSRQVKKERPYGCPNCVANGRPNCNHCFVCGEEGHRAVGCLKRPKPTGNSPRSQQWDHL